MYSSISLLLVGNNSLVEKLRCLTSIELYLHSEFYGKHCCFESAEFSQRDAKKPNKSFFYLSLKHATIDLGFKNFSDAVKHEAILNCVNNEWCSFMCLLGLSSVLKSQIHSFYPDIGDLMCKQLFNQVIVPRIQNTQQKCFRILFCRIEPFGSFCKLQTFQPNHFVPLLRLFKNSLESKGTRTMGAKRVHVSVPKMENSLSFKQRRLEFPKSTSFLRNSCNIVTCYSSSPSTFLSTISSEDLLSVNSVSTIAGLPVTVSAVNACVSTSMSDDMKNLFTKKKGILNFAFPKSVISLPTNVNRNVICFSSSSTYSSSTITTKHSRSQDSVPTPLSLSSSVSPSSNAASNSHSSKVTFSEFDSLKSKTGDKVSSNIRKSVTVINNLPANNLPVISDDIKKLLGNRKDISTFCSLKNVSNADKLTFIKNIFIPGKSFVFPKKSDEKGDRPFQHSCLEILGYYGAGAVSGHVNGLSALIMSENSKALYTHCASHRLFGTSCKISSVRNLMDVIKDISYFF